MYYLWYTILRGRVWKKRSFANCAKIRNIYHNICMYDDEINMINNNNDDDVVVLIYYYYYYYSYSFFFICPSTMLRLKATLGREQWQYCMTPTWPVLEVDYGHKAYSFLDMDSTLTFLSCAALASYLLVKNRTKAPSRGKSEKAKRNNIKGLEKKVLEGSG